jgi:hypothetical protein
MIGVRSTREGGVPSNARRTQQQVGAGRAT